MSENERTWFYRELSAEQQKAKSQLLMHHIAMYRTLKDCSESNIDLIKRWDDLRHDCIRQYTLLLRVMKELESEVQP